MTHAANMPLDISSFMADTASVLRLGPPPPGWTSTLVPDRPQPSYKMVGVSTILISYWRGDSMTEEMKHIGYGLHSDHGAATVDTDVKGS